MIIKKNQRVVIISNPKRCELRCQDIQGFKFLKPLEDFLPRLREVCEHPNRELTFDRYLLLLLLYFLNPALTGLRSVHRASELANVQRAVGINKPVSLGSLSEAAHVFPPEELLKIIQRLAARIPAPPQNSSLHAIKEKLVAVDGTVLQALSRMPWALWIDENNRAAKAHVQFDIRKGIPVHSILTHANAAETRILRENLKEGNLYILDRGYSSLALFDQIIQAKSSFVCRLRDRVQHECSESRPLTEEDWRAGVVNDRSGLFISKNRHYTAPQQAIRIVTIRIEKDGKSMKVRLGTNRQDLPAATIALIYKHRWDVELFFRWIKSQLNIEHFFGESPDATVIQFYAAMIVTLLFVLYGLKPSKITYEMLSFHIMGWATEQEVIDFLKKRIQKRL